MIPSSFRLGREVVKTLHKLSREVGMSCFVCFVLRLKNRGKEKKKGTTSSGAVDVENGTMLGNINPVTYRLGHFGGKIPPKNPGL